MADELEIPWQELLEAKTDEIGIVSSENEFPSCRFHTLSDVINALFTITEIKDIAFQLTCAKPPESPDWTSALMVDGKGNGFFLCNLQLSAAFLDCITDFFCGIHGKTLVIWQSHNFTFLISMVITVYSIRVLRKKSHALAIRFDMCYSIHIIINPLIFSSYFDFLRKTRIE